MRRTVTRGLLATVAATALTLGVVGMGAVIAFERSASHAPVAPSVAHPGTATGSEGILARVVSARPPKLANHSPLHHADMIAVLAAITACSAVLFGWFVVERRAGMPLRFLAAGDGARAPPLQAN